MIKIEENSANLNVEVSASAFIAANIEPKTKIDVVVGDAAKMDVQKAVNYIQSGKAEINQAVDEGLEVFNQNAELKTQDFNDNALSKTQSFDENANQKISDYNDNASQKEEALESYVDDASGFALDANASAESAASSAVSAAQSAAGISSLQTQIEQNTADILTKQDTLVSGTNIKTINNQSILGSGNIDIQSGGGVWGSITGTLSNQTDLQNALNAKVNKSGDTMTGILNINRDTGSNFVNLKSGQITRGAIPSSLITLGFLALSDKNGQWVGKNQMQFNTAGEYKMELSTRNASNDTTSKLSVGFDNNNVAFATAPETSTARTNAADIVTRGFFSSSLSSYALTSSLSAVATSGSYNDLSDKPTIPDVSTKANIDADNFTTNGKLTLTSFSFPSMTYVNMTLGASGAEYTAPSDGWVLVQKVATGGSQYVGISRNGTMLARQWSSVANVGYTVLAPVTKGTFKVSYTMAGATEAFRFYYPNGAV